MFKTVVAIPTYKNFGKTIGMTLTALSNQTYKNFRVLIVYKPYPNDSTLSVINSLQNKLNIDIIFQENGYVEEALNLIFKYSDADILLLTDDDSIPDPRWVQLHLKLHKKYKQAGIIGGLAKPDDLAFIQKPAQKVLQACKNFFKEIFYKYTDFKKPLLHQLKNYSSFINTIGLFVNQESAVFQKGIFIKPWRSMDVKGVNMSIKREVYDNFKLLCYTIRGLRYEQLLALNSLLRGYEVLKVAPCSVTHLKRESLSRSKKRYSQILFETYLLPYGVWKIYGNIDLGRLKLYCRILHLFNKILRRVANDKTIAVRLSALKLATTAIKNRKPPEWVREKTRKLFYS